MSDSVAILRLTMTSPGEEYFMNGAHHKNSNTALDLDGKECDAHVNHALHINTVVMTYMSERSVVIEWPLSVWAFQKQDVAERIPALDF